MITTESQEKKQPTKEKIELLMSDWLGNLREDGTFIHKDTKGAITLTVDKDYSPSEYSFGKLNDGDVVEMMKQARNIAQRTVDLITRENVNVFMGGNDSYCGLDNEGKYNICIATDYFDKKDISTNNKVDILTGMAIHEALHVDYSQMNNMPTIRNKTDALRNNIENILEDERIEMLLGTSALDGGKDMPGLTDYIAETKKYIFGRFNETKKELGIEKVKERIPSFINTILKAVRFPTALTEDEIIENIEEIEAVKDVLTPFPKSCREVRTAANKIVKIMSDMIKDEQEKKQEQEQKQEQKQDNQKSKGDENGADNQESGQSKEGENGAGNNSGNNDKSNEKDKDNSKTSNGQSEGGKSQQQRQQQDNSPKTLEEALNTNEGKAMMNAMEKMKNATKGNYSNTEKNIRNNSNIKEYVNNQCEKVEGEGAGDGSIGYIKYPKGNQARYMSSFEKIKQYIPAMKKALRCKMQDRDYQLIGMKSGKLNPYKLAALEAGNTNIFTQSGTVTKDSACVCVLIDESSSMGNTKIEESRKAAILINEALKTIPNLEFFCYGFTTGVINIYHEYNKVNKWALSEAKAVGGTPTDEAMRICSKRIRKYTNNKCLMLIITDGEPSDITKTKEQDKLLKKKGFIPVGIDITGGKAVIDVFEDAISIPNIDRLALNLSRIVKSKLSKAVMSHDSIA